ncbi:hypothetical protein GX50_07783 [[Emmonsia] crescens]|uniref:Uncharacterized protein n=1 Tax=[Emmonsia] crescens TaxID=73230 RepID=A0A2B7Z8C2_9EURO|nr:hypothetical protein GX50_07783 [Emmonsia crescens]
MSTTPTPPHRQINRGVMMRGPSLVTTTTTMIATTATAAASSASSSSATEPPNININNSFTDSAIDMDTSSGNITQTPDTTATTTTNMMMTINATTPPPEESITTIMITERLLRLACLVADSNSSSNSNSDNNNNSDDNKNNNLTYPHMSSSPSPSLSRQKFIAINRYLDDIEGLLLDPHDDEVGVDGDGENEEEEEGEEEKEEEEKSEVGTTKSPSSTSSCTEGHEKAPNHMISVSSSKHQHQHPHPPLSSSVSRPEPEIEFQNGKGQSQTQRHSQVNHHNELDVLMQDLKIVTRCLEQRRTECLHLNAVFTVKCERLAQRILEMEDEIDEFRAEKIENTIELESLKGTVRGLEGWIRRWNKKRQEEADVYVDVDSEYTWSSEYSDNGRGEWGDNRNHQGRLVVEEEEEEVSDNNGKDDIDTLMDGISAWLRGWSEVEEGFRIRARLRKRRVAMRFKKISSEGLID